MPWPLLCISRYILLLYDIMRIDHRVHNIIQQASHVLFNSALFVKIVTLEISLVYHIFNYLDFLYYLMIKLSLVQMHTTAVFY